MDNGQRAWLANRQGETDLAWVGGEWYWMTTCVVPDAPLSGVAEFVGVDLGVAQMASDSDGRIYRGSEIKSVRHRQRRRRAKLPRKPTRSAQRRLKKLSGKERRLAQHVNPVIRKPIVETAQRTGRGMAIEKRTGIRERIRARRKPRAVLHRWAFAQRAALLDYKAKLAGVPLVVVDPRNSSRECAACGHIAKPNRPSQSEFRCVWCGHEAHADTHAALVIRGRAMVSAPNVASGAVG